MKKLSLLGFLFLVVILVPQVRAQTEGWYAGVKGGFFVPMNDEFKLIAGNGVGGGVGAAYGVTSQTFIKLLVGYHTFGEKTFGPEALQVERQLTFIPIEAGLNYYFSPEGPRFYVSVVGGAFIRSGDYSGTNVGSGLGVGYQVPFSEGKVLLDFELEVRADFASNVNTYGAFNLGVAFKLGQ